jgi:hypothetical protein
MKKKLNLDIIKNAYLKLCKDSGCYISFGKFHIIYDEFIPFSLYQKINVDKLERIAGKAIEKSTYG